MQASSYSPSVVQEAGADRRHKKIDTTHVEFDIVKHVFAFVDILLFQNDFTWCNAQRLPCHPVQEIFIEFAKISLILSLKESVMETLRGF